MKKNIIAIGIGVVIIGATLVFVLNKEPRTPTPPVNPVTIVDGKQIIDLRAKGGFSPRKITAQAGIPTTLRVTTKATFDCSSSIRIPSLNINQNLQQTGVAEFDLGTQPAGVLDGSCGMGMYPFEIEFQ